ncbi:MAG: hypothetical protein AVDCRST_MAG69-581, partial [uncultured Solirubrobacteraceae bacterium]
GQWRGSGLGAGGGHGSGGGFLPRHPRPRGHRGAARVERGQRQRAADRPERARADLIAIERRRGDLVPAGRRHRGRGQAPRGGGRRVHRRHQRPRVGPHRRLQGHGGQRPPALRPAQGL